MKRIFHLFVLVVLSTLFVSKSICVAQTTIKPKSLIINLGLGVGNDFYRKRPHNDIVVRAVGVIKPTVEYAVAKLGPGVLGIGAALPISFYRETYHGTYYGKSVYSGIGIGILARATYHYDWKVKKLDTYAGIEIGYRGFRDKVDVEYQSGNQNFKYWTNDFGFSVIAGVAYYFSPSVGVFAEVGYGLTWLNAGLSIKLGGK